eukprot:PhM_4_TR7313/c0_g1_i1/m.87853
MQRPTRVLQINRDAIPSLEKHGYLFVGNEAALAGLPARMAGLKKPTSNNKKKKQGNNNNNNEPPPVEFGWSIVFDPGLVDKVCLSGCFPMTIDFGIRVFAIKLHEERCVLNLLLNNNNNVSRSVRKLSQKYLFSLNTAFDEVAAMINEQHGKDWMCPELRDCFRYMFLNPHEFSTKIISVEIRDKDDDNGVVVAGELGYIVGDVYTSLTGARTVSGTGTLQLEVLKRFLSTRCGVHWWDFGMSMQYKTEMGGANVPRKEWLAMAAAAAQKSAVLGSAPIGAVPCSEFFFLKEGSHQKDLNDVIVVEDEAQRRKREEKKLEKLRRKQQAAADYQNRQQKQKDEK